MFIVLTLISCLCYSQNNNIYEDSIAFDPKSKLGDYIEFARAISKKTTSPLSYEINLGYSRKKINEITYVVKVSGLAQGVWWEAVRVNSNPYKLLNGVNFAADYNAGQNDTKFRLRIIGASRSDTSVKVYLKIRSIGGNAEWKPLKQKGNEPAKIKSSRVAWNAPCYFQSSYYHAIVYTKKQAVGVLKLENM